MTDPKKVISWLRPALDTGDCLIELPYNVVKAIYELLKAQEPRVLTFGDVIACSSRKEWLWFEENAYGYVEESSMICAQIYSFGDSWISVDVPSQTHDETIEFDNENYGKTWRCWTAKPTDEQREAVPWQD